MPEILKTLQQVEYDIDTDGMNLEALDTDEIASKFQVNTGITFEKEVATAALSELVVATKEAFMPYVEQTLAVLVSEVENTYGLKEAFITSIWAVISGTLLKKSSKHLYKVLLNFFNNMKLKIQNWIIKRPIKCLQ